MIFVSGGVRSGKSTFAERLAARRANSEKGTLHYVATGRAVDAEMAQRIQHHRRGREASGAGWKTVECSSGLEQIAHKFHENSVILIDCLTTWLSNELFTRDCEPLDASVQEKVFETVVAAAKEFQRVASLVIVVSNELLGEPFIHD
ncbi:MAG TPA: bifunctional adenosylcobinamide kinase/adenosylcobinamide-phosphate guanylyltransferase, partial [Bacillales bacterium]|nr:bifunctional adenosylcobinamide kinase/adenosylcobinamide-phosphate guanylyltransferase [Bacillales bacterium]